MESSVPAFSIFSATSEIFVTIAVLYAVISNLRGRALPYKLLGAVLVFELVVNIMYMTGRAAEADKSTELSTSMKIMFAGHGMLSLLMFIGLAILYMLAVKDIKEGQAAWFSRHPTGSWIFVFFWMVSVISGEAIFLWRYGGALFGG